MFTALAVAVVATILAVVEALLTYPRLPPRVPLNFDFAGRPRSYGSKWLLVSVLGLALAAVVLSLFAIVFGWSGTAKVGDTVVLACVAAFVAYVAHLIYGAAMTSKTLARRPFWAAFTALLMIATAVAAARA